MNSLRELVTQSCPGGIPIMQLGELAKKETRKNSSRACNLAFSITQDGLIPTNDFFKEADITSSDTSSYRLVEPGWFVYSPSRIDVGSVDYHHGSSIVMVSPIDVVFSVDASRIDNDYLLYFLKCHNGWWQTMRLTQGIPGTGRKTLPFESFAKMKVPVPPLEVQREVVRILDSFNGLIARLDEELAAREKQLQYYRIVLLQPTTDSNWIKLGELAKIRDKDRKPIKKEARLSGPYPYYGASGIVDYVNDYIFDGDYLLISEDGANLLSRTQPIAFQIHGKSWVNNHAHVLEISNPSIRRKWLSTSGIVRLPEL